MTRPAHARPHCSVRVDGDTYWSIHEAYAEAKRRGFDGSEATFAYRVRRATEPTWTTLAKPVTSAHRAITAKRAATHSAKRAEMAAVIAALDARKAGIA